MTSRHHHPARRALVAAGPGDATRQGGRLTRDPGRSPVLRFVLGLLAAAAVFGLAELIHHTGNNPFLPAAVAVSSPAPATERAGMGDAG